MVLLKTHFRRDIREIFELLNLKYEYFHENEIFSCKNHLSLFNRGLIHENNCKKISWHSHFKLCVLYCVYTNIQIQTPDSSDYRII